MSSRARTAIAVAAWLALLTTSGDGPNARPRVDGLLVVSGDLVARLAPPAVHRKDRVLVADPGSPFRARLIELKPGTAARFEAELKAIGDRLEAGEELSTVATELVVRHPGASVV